MITPMIETTPAILRNTIERYFTATHLPPSKKAAAMVDCFAKNSVNHDPAEGPALEGHDNLHQFFESIVALFEDVSLTADFISINGNEAAVKWSGSGKGKNGVEVQFEGIDWFTFNEQGQIQSMKAYWNPGVILSQLNQQS